MTNVPFINKLTNELSKRKLKSEVVANAILDIAVGNNRLDNLIANGVVAPEGLTGAEIEETLLQAHLSKDAIEKIEGLQASASEIDAVSNVIDSRLAPIHKLFREAANGVNNVVTYIVSGDSTRENSFNEMIQYYTSQFSKISVTVYSNASSGQTAQDWKNNSDQTTLQQAIDNSSGIDGGSTILEYSFGINDYKNGATKAEVKGYIQEGINLYLQAKPKGIIILAQPVKTDDATRNIILQEIYNELASENDFLLIDVYSATDGVQGNIDYYQDGTHPNRFGSRRIVNFILNYILPLEFMSIVSIDEASSASPGTTNLNSEPTKIGKYWSASDGSELTSALWRSLAPIDIEPNFTLDIAHQGDRTDVIFMDSQLNFISRVFLTNIEVGLYKIKIPVNAFQIRVNLSNEGTTYDSLSDEPSVTYRLISENYLSTKQINDGIEIRNVKNKFRNDIIVDAYGRIGAVGQTLTIDANNKMKWA